MTRTATKEIKELSPFTPWPWQVPVLDDTSPVILLGGSAGGGKSRIAAEKVAAFCLYYPGATGLVLRKKRDDMDQSSIPLVKDEVLRVDDNPIAVWRAREDRVTIDHGPDKPASEILFTGLFDAKARRGLRSIGKSGAVDIAWMEEGIEFEEDDFNALLSRMRGNAAPWTQIIVTTNPGPTMHWINRRLILGGEARFYPSSAADNPANPDHYVNRLDSLTGIEGARMRDGLWVDGVGLVVETWMNDYSSKPEAPTGNVTPKAEYDPRIGNVVWFMDDGYAGEWDEKTGFFTAKSNPRVCLMAQITNDDRIHVFNEDYKLEKLANVHIEELIAECQKKGWALPKKVIHDSSSPSLGGQIAKAGLQPVAIRSKTIEEGLVELREWVGKDKNDRRSILVHPRCHFLVLEMGSYTKDSSGAPIDAFNHGPDALRYGVWYLAHGGMPDTSLDSYGLDGENLQAIFNRVEEMYNMLEERFDARR